MFGDLRACCEIINKMDLKQKAIISIRWTTFSSLFSSLFSFVQILILVRLLDKSDFGLMALVNVVIGIIAMLSNFGISNAIIHKQEIKHVQLSTLYWLNVFVGILLFILLLLLSPLVVGFYETPILQSLLLYMGFTLIISAFGAQFQTLLEKELEFETLAKIQVVAVLISFLVTVLLAYTGSGVMALVFGAIVGVVFHTLGYIFFGLKKHRPSLIFRPKTIHFFLKFGLFQMGERIVNYFNTQFDTILIGKILGMEALGLYDVVKKILMRPAYTINPIVIQVGFPLMSKLQNSPERLKKVYLDMLLHLNALNFPIYIALFLLAQPIVVVFLGVGWEKAIPIFEILAFYYLVRATGNPIGSLCLAKGRADLGFYWNLTLFFIIPLAILLGSFYGLIGITWALLLLQVLLVLPNYLFLVKKIIVVSWKEYFLVFFQPLLLAIMASLLPFYLMNYFHPPIFQIVISLIIGGSIYLILSHHFNKKVVASFKKLISW